MNPLFQVAEALQTVLTCTADNLAKTMKVIRRQRKFSGASLAQTFVLGWLSNPRASLDELAQTAAACGAAVKPQAVAQRMTPELATFFKQLLEAATTEVIATQPVSIKLLQRFNGVYVQDSTVIKLPDCYVEEYPGCGGGTAGQTNAAVKFQVQLNLTTGLLKGPFPEAGKASDQNSCIQQMPLPVGSLRMADLGYFSLKTLADLGNQGVYWISRIQLNTSIFYEGNLIDLCSWLEKKKFQSIDLQVEVGATEHLSCRLLSVRCPTEIARRRIEAVKKDARRRGRKASKAQLEWCKWTVLITNASVTKLSPTDANVLYRARWQIEMLFKLWKEHGLVDESRHSSDAAKLVEIYAKLIGVVIQHWLLVSTVWSYTDRSLVKASKAIRKHVTLMIAFLQSHITATVLIGQIAQALQTCSRIDPRKTKPNTHQILENTELLGYDMA